MCLSYQWSLMRKEPLSPLFRYWYLLRQLHFSSCQTWHNQHPYCDLIALVSIFHRRHIFLYLIAHNPKTCGINHLFHKAVGLEINQPGRILESLISYVKIQYKNRKQRCTYLRKQGNRIIFKFIIPSIFFYYLTTKNGAYITS